MVFAILVVPFARGGASATLSANADATTFAGSTYGYGLRQRWRVGAPMLARRHPRARDEVGILVDHHARENTTECLPNIFDARCHAIFGSRASCLRGVRGVVARAIAFREARATRTRPPSSPRRHCNPRGLKRPRSARALGEFPTNSDETTGRLLSTPPYHDATSAQALRQPNNEA